MKKHKAETLWIGHLCFADIPTKPVLGF
uniref:Uncharacterized protein n=1 Tax=Anguilla anguilla TaxID=7936 RepID=A0A0E9PXR9_ANGAN